MGRNETFDLLCHLCFFSSSPHSMSEALTFTLDAFTLVNYPIGTILRSTTVIENGHAVVYEVRRAKSLVMPLFTRNNVPIQPSIKDIAEDGRASVFQYGGGHRGGNPHTPIVGETSPPDTRREVPDNLVG